MRCEKFLLISLFAANLVACAGGKPRPDKLIGPIPPEEIAAHIKNGTGVIEGQAFMKTVGGDVKYGAGESVCLTPDTPYRDKIIAAQLSGYRAVVSPDYMKISKCTKADGSGRFTFEDLPTASWTIEANVTWAVVSCTRYSCYQSPQGGPIHQKVVSADGKVIKVVVTR